MRIMLIGYGKMGKAIHKIAEERGNSIDFIIDHENAKDLQKITSKEVDVAIEFSRPDSAFENIKTCIQNGIPVVAGTTGWLDKMEEVEALVEKHNGSFFYASNYSVGVNLFFKLNKILASLMNSHKNYDISMEEIHHIHKLDAPSGTAITLAEGIFGNHSGKDSWDLEQTGDKILPITAVRENEVPGTHIVTYSSNIDKIEIKHEAFNREGFATGAVIAAEWLPKQKGCFGMDDMLDL